MFTYNELYDMFYKTFKRDLMVNIRNKDDKTLPDVLNPYVDYMINLRDMFYKTDSCAHFAYTNALYDVKKEIKI